MLYSVEFTFPTSECLKLRRAVVAAQRLVVYGAGAIGGTIGAYLAHAGTEVLLVDRNRDHVAAMRQNGLTIQTKDGSSFTQPVTAVLPEDLNGPLDAVFLCTKQQATEEAIRHLAPLIAPDGYVASVQNGLNENLIASVVGPERTIGCFVNFSADLLEPGVISYAGPSTMAFGELDGRMTERLTAIHDLLLPLQEVTLTPNVGGYLWSKVAYGALLFATAMTDATMAECVEHPRYRWTLVEIARESIGLARRQGLELYPFDGWDPNAVDDRGRAATMMDALAAVMKRNTKVRTGVWRDLAVHHRKTEADVEFVPLFALADRLGHPMPLTHRMVEIIHTLEDGTAERGFHNLESVHRIAFPSEEEHA